VNDSDAAYFKYLVDKNGRLLIRLLIITVLVPFSFQVLKVKRNLVFFTDGWMDEVFKTCEKDRAVRGI
jgi:hypothetical protein